MTKLRKKRLYTLCLLVALFLLSSASLLLGSVRINFTEVLNYITGSGDISSTDQTIIREFRIPKLFTAIIAGAGLSVAGLQMQTIFRNPLAGPYILGVSAGAGLGVALLVLGFQEFSVSNTLYGSWAFVTAAWLGAASLMAVIFAVSLRIKDVMTVLILGILFSGAVSALINVLQYFGAAENLKSFVVWTMGSVSGLSFSQLYVLASAAGIGLVIAVFSVNVLDVLLLGEQYAQSSGLNLIKARLAIFTSTSVLAGTVTAFCGPIGFVGIIVPHLARMLFQTSEHSVLLPASALIGALVLLLSDIISQLPGIDTVLPLNSVTALIGIPMVIYILLKNKV
jgi:iron complex transport system permease protein